MAFLELSGISKSYGEGRERTDVLEDLNLSVGDGEFIAIVGFSGSGKTTLISIIAGLVTPDAGEVPGVLPIAVKAAEMENNAVKGGVITRDA